MITITSLNCQSNNCNSLPRGIWPVHTLAEANPVRCVHQKPPDDWPPGGFFTLMHDLGAVSSSSAAMNRTTLHNLQTENSQVGCLAFGSPRGPHEFCLCPMKTYATTDIHYLTRSVILRVL
jgi:hypothetical protein